MKTCKVVLLCVAVIVFCASCAKVLPPLETQTPVQSTQTPTVGPTQTATAVPTLTHTPTLEGPPPTPTEDVSSLQGYKNISKLSMETVRNIFSSKFPLESGYPKQTSEGIKFRQENGVFFVISRSISDEGAYDYFGILSSNGNTFLKVSKGSLIVFLFRGNVTDFAVMYAPTIDSFVWEISGVTTSYWFPWTSLQEIELSIDGIVVRMPSTQNQLWCAKAAFNYEDYEFYTLPGDGTYRWGKTCPTIEIVDSMPIISSSPTP